MASTTLAQLRTRAREHADMISSSFVGTSELDGFINASGGELWDLLMTRYEDYCTTPGYTQFSVTGSNYQEVLPSDFIKLRGLEYEDSGDWVTMRRYTLEDRDRWRDNQWNFGSDQRRYIVIGGFTGGVISIVPEDAATGTYRYRYVKAWTPLTGSGDSIALPNGWEEYIAVDAAIKCKQKEESDASMLMMQKASLLTRIESAATNRDASEQDFISDPGYDWRRW